jgi:hypothetical protein
MVNAFFKRTQMICFPSLIPRLATAGQMGKKARPRPLGPQSRNVITSEQPLEVHWQRYPSPTSGAWIVHCRQRRDAAPARGTVWCVDVPSELHCPQISEGFSSRGCLMTPPSPPPCRYVRFVVTAWRILSLSLVFLLACCLPGCLHQWTIHAPEES